MKTALPFGVCVSAAVMIITGVGCRPRQSTPAGQLPPAIEVIRSIDLGPRPLASSVECEIPIANRGDHDLVVTDIDSGCGCIGVRIRDSAAQVAKGDQLLIGPRQSICLIVTFKVAGSPEAPVSRHLTFKTNDEKNSDVSVRITALPLARYFAAPGELVLGPVAPGEAIERTVVVLAAARDLDPITMAASSNPVISAEYLPSTAAEAPDRGNVEFGRIRISIRAPDAIGHFSGVITAHRAKDRDAALTIPVSGVVSHPIRLTPEVLALPRSSSSGLVYQGVCVCHSVVGNAPLSVKVVEAPRGVLVNVGGDDQTSSVKLIRVDASALRGSLGKNGATLHVTLLAEANGRSKVLKLELQVAPPDSSGSGER